MQFFNRASRQMFLSFRPSLLQTHTQGSHIFLQTHTLTHLFAIKCTNPQPTVWIVFIIPLFHIWRQHCLSSSSIFKSEPDSFALLSKFSGHTARNFRLLTTFPCFYDSETVKLQRSKLVQRVHRSSFIQSCYVNLICMNILFNFWFLEVVIYHNLC